MKIGKHIITGIYKYTPGCHPTKDDLILYNGNLWVCTTNNPDLNKEPGVNEDGLISNSDYELYLAPNIATEEEILSILEDDNSKEWPDKAIPLSSLDLILSKVYYGLD
jgi:hypothetical protein